MESAPIILLTGASGQVGAELRTLLAPLGNVIAPTRAELDLTSPDLIRNMMRSVRPHWVVNPAAYTAVDKAESEEALAFAVNATAPAVFAEEAKKIGAAMIHFSTDYVFDGTKPAPYVETDNANPLSVYGRSKLAGEQAIAASGVAHIIFRTSWIYGTRGKNFLLTILKLASEREELRIVADQHGAPTWSRDLAVMTAQAIARLEPRRDRNNRSPEAMHEFDGIYHASNSGETTWFGFAEEALRLRRAQERQKVFARLQPISTSEYPTPACRPQNSLLCCDRLRERFDLVLPPWQSSLVQVLAQRPE